MTLNELSAYFDGFLEPGRYAQDPSRNGVQVDNSAPGQKPIGKVAFAVDACEQTAREAAARGAGLLFVHHGLFWGDCTPVTGTHYRRLSAFLSADLALYAAHIPLDANAEVGNNYGIARRMGLAELRPFGQWRGMTIGVQGTLPEPVSAGELARLLFPDGEEPARILDWGPRDIRSVAIISGGAGHDAVQAKQAGADAYITGEVLHEDFHVIKELGLTVIAGGHYQTETVGVRLVQQKLGRETGMETTFIDAPTGL